MNQGMGEWVNKGKAVRNSKDRFSPGRSERRTEGLPGRDLICWSRSLWSALSIGHRTRCVLFKKIIMEATQSSGS